MIKNIVLLKHRVFKQLLVILLVVNGCKISPTPIEFGYKRFDGSNITI